MTAEADRLNELTKQIIGAAIAVHQELGPGLLESPYEVCLAIELARRGLFVERQKPYAVRYRGIPVRETAFRIDMLVNRDVVVEIKSIEQLTRVHIAQVLTYLNIANCRVGLLFNFNVKHLLADGFKRVVNRFPDSSLAGGLGTA